LRSHLARTLMLIAMATGLSRSSHASLDGAWVGVLRLPDAKLHFGVVFENRDGELGGRIRIVEEGSRVVELSEVRREGDRLEFALDTSIGRAVFSGVDQGRRIAGRFVQGAVHGRFKLRRAPESPDAVRPPRGEPIEQDISFTNSDVKFSGTVSLPSSPGPHPALVLCGGSGGVDRDGFVYGFRPLRLIAHHLTARGFLVLRYDDRGVGNSTGERLTATTSERADDAIAALSALKERADVAPDRVGLLGHSEGGTVAALAAARSRAAFVVLLAGIAVRGDRLLAAQAADLSRAAGATEEEAAQAVARINQVVAAARSDKGWDAVEAAVADEVRADLESLPPSQRRAIGDVEEWVAQRVSEELRLARSRWYRAFVDFDPTAELSLVTCPVLALFGGLDRQVQAAMNESALRNALPHNAALTVKVYPTANHLFLAGRTGSPSEYADLPKRFVAGLLDDVADWIAARVGSVPPSGN
jgi:uncharacterized protein